MSEYENVLKRLVAYRQQIGATQEKMGRLIHVTQSQYSKIELGKIIISYNALSILKAHDWDIDYLITGRRYPDKASGITKIYDGAATERKPQIIELFYWVVNNTGGCEEDKTLNFEWKYLRHRVRSVKKDEHPFEIVRQIYNVTQYDMTETLSVNIKKYRDLEKEMVYPDAQIMSALYENMYCRPAIVLGRDDVDRMIMNDLWEAFTPERQKKIMDILKYALKNID